MGKRFLSILSQSFKRINIKLALRNECHQLMVLRRVNESEQEKTINTFVVLGSKKQISEVLKFNV